MKYLKSYTLLFLSLLFLGACESKMEKPEFDRTAFLENYAKNIIQPNITDLRTEIEQLQTVINTFIEEPNLANLDAAQNAWDITYKAWMWVNSYNFGPGSTSGLRRTLAEEIGTWPVDIEETETKIVNDNPDFEDSKRNTRGLLVIEYLLFGMESNEALLNRFDEKRAFYLQKTVGKSVAQITDFDAAWQGDFVNEFIADNGTSVRSSTTLMYNEFLRSFESIKDLKLGIPLGVIAGQTEAQPELVETRFSKNSLDYALLHYQAIVDLWYGRNSDGIDGIGWQEYLLSVEGGEALVDATVTQLEEIQNIIDRLPKDRSLQDLAVENNQTVIKLQNELQNLTRFLKSDLSSLLSLAITFSSMDGD